MGCSCLEIYQLHGRRRMRLQARTRRRVLCNILYRCENKSLKPKPDLQTEYYNAKTVFEYRGAGVIYARNGAEDEDVLLVNYTRIGYCTTNVSNSKRCISTHLKFNTQKGIPDLYRILHSKGDFFFVVFVERAQFSFVIMFIYLLNRWHILYTTNSNTPLKIS